MQKVGVVGATSVLGKELIEELDGSSFGRAEIVPFEAEDDEAGGRLTAMGDEAALVQALTPEALQDLTLVFFAGSSDATQDHWKTAVRQGVAVIDLTGALRGVAGIPVLAPGVASARSAGTSVINLETTAVVAAHPAAVLFGLIGARLSQGAKAVRMTATLFEPASQHGTAAMDELHEQTVQLLSFKSADRPQYGAQVVFNMLPALPEDAEINLVTVQQDILSDYQQIEPRLPILDLEVIQAPVFHGYVASVLVEFSQPQSLEQVERALAGEGVSLTTEAGDPPSNLVAAGQKDILVQFRPLSAQQTRGEQIDRLRLWIAADNLKLAALNAIRCGEELRRLLPKGGVQ